MFRRQALVSLPQRQALRGLNEPARTIRIFFQIHVGPLISTSRLPDKISIARDVYCGFDLPHAAAFLKAKTSSRR
jgi:hypothetical protein